MAVYFASLGVCYSFPVYFWDMLFLVVPVCLILYLIVTVPVGVALFISVAYEEGG